jgi:hypothetical protein
VRLLDKYREVPLMFGCARVLGWVDGGMLPG